MAVTSFAASDVVDGLVTTLRAGTGFRAPTEAGTDVPVFNGPVFGAGSNFSAVTIGSDGTEDPTQRPFRFTSDWHDVDLTADEVGTVQCAVVVWAGDANASTAADQRATAVGILQDVDQIIRATVAASELGVTDLLWSKIDSAECIQTFAEGTETRIPFTFGYRALLQVT